MSSGTHDIRKEVKKYIAVFGGLLVLTVITVMASNFRVGVTVGIIVALIIATVKGGLVACNFMHLASEKKLIYVILILTGIFFAALMILMCIAHFNVPEGLKYVS